MGESDNTMADELDRLHQHPSYDRLLHSPASSAAPALRLSYGLACGLLLLLLTPCADWRARRQSHPAELPCCAEILFLLTGLFLAGSCTLRLVRYTRASVRSFGVCVTWKRSSRWAGVLHGEVGFATDQPLTQRYLISSTLYDSFALGDLGVAHVRDTFLLKFDTVDLNPAATRLQQPPPQGLPSAAADRFLRLVAHPSYDVLMHQRPFFGRPAPSALGWMLAGLLSSALGVWDFLGLYKCYLDSALPGILFAEFGFYGFVSGTFSLVRALGLPIRAFPARIETKTVIADRRGKSVRTICILGIMTQAGEHLRFDVPESVFGRTGEDDIGVALVRGACLLRFTRIDV